jgi:acyl dehydratase
VKLTAELVGVQLGTIATELTSRQAMNFAASVGDNNPWYFDDERPEGAVAPPMLAVSLIWPLATAYTDTLQARGYSTALRRQVHYTEHLVWHRPMRPGDAIEITGEVVGMSAHSAGTYGLIKFEARDNGGDPVFTEYSGALFRGVRCEGESMGGTTVLPDTPDRVEEAAPLWTQTIHIDPLATHLYDGCADLHFPIHTSRRFAHKVGLPDPIIHGTYTLAVAMRELLNREGDGDPTRLRATACRFTGMVFPDTDITVRLVGTSDGRERNLFFDVINGDGKRVISEGYLALR